MNAKQAYEKAVLAQNINPSILKAIKREAQSGGFDVNLTTLDHPNGVIVRDKDYEWLTKNGYYISLRKEVIYPGDEPCDCEYIEWGHKCKVTAKQVIKAMKNSKHRKQAINKICFRAGFPLHVKGKVRKILIILMKMGVVSITDSNKFILHEDAKCFDCMSFDDKYGCLCADSCNNFDMFLGIYP